MTNLFPEDDEYKDELEDNYDDYEDEDFDDPEGDELPRPLGFDEIEGMIVFEGDEQLPDMYDPRFDPENTDEDF